MWVLSVMEACADGHDVCLHICASRTERDSMAAANSKVKVVSDEDVGNVCGFTLIKKDAISVTATKEAVPIFKEKEYEVLGTLNVASPVNGLGVAPESFEAVTLHRHKTGDRRVVLHHGGSSYEGLKTGKVARKPWSWNDATQELKDGGGDLVDHRNWKPAKAGSKGKADKPLAAAKEGGSANKRPNDDAKKACNKKRKRGSADATVPAAASVGLARVAQGLPGVEDGAQGPDARNTRSTNTAANTAKAVLPRLRRSNTLSSPGQRGAGAAHDAVKTDALSVGDAVEWTADGAHPAAGLLERRSGRSSGKGPAPVTTGTVTKLADEGLVVVMWKRGSKQSSTMCGVQDITKAVDSA